MCARFKGSSRESKAGEYRERKGKHGVSTKDADSLFFHNYGVIGAPFSAQCVGAFFAHGIPPSERDSLERPCVSPPH